VHNAKPQALDKFDKICYNTGVREKEEFLKIHKFNKKRG